MSGAPERAAVLAIGDELLNGAHPDLDTPRVARALAQLGILVERAGIERDDVDAIAARIEEFARGARLVVTTGGLGPTDDDVTRDAVARVAGVALDFHDGAWDAIVARFAYRGVAPPESNRRQALIPRGATLLENAQGTAPGFLVELDGGRVLASLPGPPRECAAVLDVLLPHVRARLGGPRVVRAAFSLVGLSESAFADRLGDWMARDTVPRMGVSAREGTLAVHFSAAESDRARLDERCAEFRARFAPWIYAEEDARLEQVVVAEARRLARTVTVSESCTGGLVAARLTSVAGASACLREAFVTYSNEAKVRTLGVPSALLDAHGAVSEPVALAMAAGARRASGADHAVAVTGIAGPDGGSAEKPVGTVCFALDGPAEPVAFTCRFPGDRERVRAFAAQVALDLLRRALLGVGYASIGWTAPPTGPDAGR